MELMKIQPTNERQLKHLFRWLGERTPEESISHKVMPTWEDHCLFVWSKPYLAWYEIFVARRFVGNIYLTHAREVGIHIGIKWRARGYGARALHLLHQKHPGPMWANVNQLNARSIEFFSRRGRLARETIDIDADGKRRVLQVTYRLDFNERG